MTSTRPTRSAGTAAGTSRVRLRSNAVLVFALVLVSLQLFLLTVAVEGLLENEPHLAWSAAALSLGLFAVSLTFGRFLRDD